MLRFTAYEIYNCSAVCSLKTCIGRQEVAQTLADDAAAPLQRLFIDQVVFPTEAILTLFFPLTVHFATSFVFQVSF